MEIEHQNITESDKEVVELFINEDLTDWGRAAYMAGLGWAGLSSDMEKVDKKLDGGVNQLNVLRAGLDRQTERDHHAKGGIR